MGLVDQVLLGEQSRKEAAIAATLIQRTGSKREISALCQALPEADSFARELVKKLLKEHGTEKEAELLFPLLLEEIQEGGTDRWRSSVDTLYLISLKAPLKSPEKVEALREYASAFEQNPYLFLLIGIFGGPEEGEALLKRYEKALPEDRPLLVKAYLLTLHPGRLAFLRTLPPEDLASSLFELINDPETVSFFLDFLFGGAPSWAWEKSKELLKIRNTNQLERVLGSIVARPESPLFSDFLEIVVQKRVLSLLPTLKELLRKPLDDAHEKALILAFLELTGESAFPFFMEIFESKRDFIKGFLLAEFFQKFKGYRLSVEQSCQIRLQWLNLYKESFLEETRVEVIRAMKQLTFNTSADYFNLRSHLIAFYKDHENDIPLRIKNTLPETLKALQKYGDLINIRERVQKEAEKLMEILPDNPKEEYLLSLRKKVEEMDEEMDAAFSAILEKFLLGLMEKNLQHYGITDLCTVLLPKIGSRLSLLPLERLRLESSAYGIRVQAEKAAAALRERLGLLPKTVHLFVKPVYLKKLLHEGFEALGFLVHEVDDPSLLWELPQDSFTALLFDLQGVEEGKEVLLSWQSAHSGRSKTVVLFLNDQEREAPWNDKTLFLKKPFSKKDVKDTAEALLG